MRLFIMLEIVALLFWNEIGPEALSLLKLAQLAMEQSEERRWRVN